MNLRIKKAIIFLALVICCANFVEAQTLPGFPTDVDDETPTAPIDGFISIAAAVGIYLGLKGKSNSEN
ncbi:hypothetical protein [Mesonia aquimarina]|uniref:hypothetical protein n=1 Tax=Mesonia aquimarina TaxID=1504967 RepID=UPI000EF5A60D|nr:hypothetical protein [Mesonia aquimarina]